jgi:hypothetical protein
VAIASFAARRHLNRQCTRRTSRAIHAIQNGEMHIWQIAGFAISGLR